MGVEGIHPEEGQVVALRWSLFERQFTLGSLSIALLDLTDARRQRGHPVERLLLALLEDLDAVMEEHEDIGDTEVSIQMTKAVHDGFIWPKPDFVLPDTFEMYTVAGNRKVRRALQRFLKKAVRMAAAEGLDTPVARLAAFQNMEVRSQGESCYNDFFSFHQHP
jgi:hypothetical protein